MEGILALMIPLAPFIMVVAIVWMANQRKLEEKRLSATAAMTAEEAVRHASRISELEDRIKVLERIVTDSGYNVATQIEALRDTRRVDEDDSGVPLSMDRKERV
ncbi:hypothetical protein [Qipengyuania oceanensis]|uniref:Phage shock protein B n=1 Tax=Qipengyuania oceanensis TaxID=1463597 RepID=A0A844YIZ1_9SPHN|nr:hypothetical protein [Qipengyuania oceanensis]MXO63907.1 hypothetical protein [Qipengyuania oceanensis]